MSVTVEFVGGPLDGEQRAVPGAPSTLWFYQFAQTPDYFDFDITRVVYRKRSQIGSAALYDHVPPT